jgi:C-terminal processing protease CtpA/Prc
MVILNEIMMFQKIIVVFCFSLYLQQVKAQPTTATKTQRLASMAKLWGTVKYFHPQLAYRSIDWDSVLIATIPAVRQAENANQFKKALQSMLSVLGDPVSRIISNEAELNQTPGNSATEFNYKFADDSVLVITAGSYFNLFSAAAQQGLNTALGEIKKAKAVIIDIRASEPGGEYGNFQLESSFLPIERMLITAPFITVGERRRVHHGFESQSGFLSSGQYKSEFITQNGKRILPFKNSKETMVVFLINKNSAVLPSMSYLQSAGKALILFEGNDGFISTAKTKQVNLCDGLTAEIRLTEPILENGNSAEVVTDITVPFRKSNMDDALNKAIQALKNFKPSQGTGKKLPAMGVSVVEKSYRDMEYPSVEYRLLAAFRIWSAIQFFYPYMHLLKEKTWDDVLLEFIPKFESAQNALEYSLTVADMVTHIHDSHAYISGKVINEHFGEGYPPVRVRMIENKPVVVSVLDTVALLAGIRVGDIIEKVDDEDAMMRINRYAKYISASTPQSRMYKAALGFMNGSPGSAVKLSVRTKGNVLKQIAVLRKFEDYNTLYHKERNDPMIKLMPGNIGYVDLDRCTADSIDYILEKFKTTKAIIFDMRGYPNGIFFWLLSPRLTDKTNIPAALLETPLVGYDNNTNSYDAYYQYIQTPPHGSIIYRGKTVLLIDERTVSQAEHTGLFFRAANGTIFIGSPTAGADGEITTLSVPGGMAIGFTGQSVSFPDRKQLQRTGLIPDLMVKPTIKGIQDGKDEVLNKAIKWALNQ